MSDDLLDGDGDFAILAGIGVLIPVIIAVLIGTSGLTAYQTSGEPVGQDETEPAITTTSSTLQPTTTAAAEATTTTLAPTPLPTQSGIEEALADAGFPTIEVTVVEREVTVSGRVADDSLRSAVLAITAEQPGVDSVIDELDPSG